MFCSKTNPAFYVPCKTTTTHMGSYQKKLLAKALNIISY